MSASREPSLDADVLLSKETAELVREPCMGFLMSSAFQFSFSILPIPMFDQRDHPSVPTMKVAGHGGGWRSRMARRATAAGGA
jgi:hypothetical protein